MEVNEALSSAFLCSWLCSQPPPAWGIPQPRSLGLSACGSGPSPEPAHSSIPTLYQKALLPPGQSFWPTVMLSPQSPCSVWVAGVVHSAGGQSPLLQREETSSFPHTPAVVGSLGEELGSCHTSAGDAELRAKARAAPTWELADRRGQDLGWTGSLQSLLAVLSLKMSQAEGHGDSSASPRVQLHVKSKGSEIKKEISGRFLVTMPVPYSLQLWGSLKVLILCLHIHKNKNYLFPTKARQ